MAVSIECELKKGYLLVRFRGHESYDDVHRFWEKLLLESEFKELKRFLIVVEPVRRLSLYEAEKLCLDLAGMAWGEVISEKEAADWLLEYADVG